MKFNWLAKILLPSAIIGVMAPTISSCAIEEDVSKYKIVFPEFENKTYLNINLANPNDTKHIRFICLDESAKDLEYTISNQIFCASSVSSTIESDSSVWYWNFKFNNPQEVTEKEGQGYATINATWKNASGRKVQASATIAWIFSWQ